jgi:hypothetical protein
MDQNKNNQNVETSIVLVSNYRLEEIERKQEEILTLLKGNSNQNLEKLNYVTEKEAIQLIGKRATWFWQMRKSGKLKFTKVGAKVFYSLDELKSLLNSGGKS